MANSTLVRIEVEGDRSAVEEALKAGRLSGFAMDSEGCLARESLWKDRFDGAAEISRELPGMAVSVAAVELGNGNAEARVFFGGETVGSYDMPDDELAEVAGPDLDEAAVLENLFSTVHAYAADAVAAANPRP